MKTLKEQIEDLDIARPQDVDPEDDPFAKRDDGSDSDEAPSEAGITGREHYEEVPKSRLRQPEQQVLGNQYTGAAVSRKTLFDEEGHVQESEADEVEDDAIDEDEDPFGKAASISSTSSGPHAVNEADADEMPEDLADGDDSDIDSDEAFASGEEEAFKSKGFVFRGSKQEGAFDGSDAEIEDEDEDEDEDGDSNEDGALVWDTEDEEEVEVGTDMEMEDLSSASGEESQDISGTDSDSDSNSSTSLEPTRNPSNNRSKLQELFANDTAVVASTLSASANADALKGRAVKQQYQAFDRLLDARIKIQKGLTAANSLSLPATPDEEISNLAKAAEIAALKLFSIIESLRHDLSSVQAASTTSKKRKRPSPPTSSTPTFSLWSQLTALESDSLPHQRAILQKWSTKTRNGSTTTSSQLDRGTTNHDSISDILDAQIASENQRNTASTDAYDDTAFYQSLLRDLIASRASLQQSGPSTQSILLPSLPKQHRKGVDPKASKGRKVRYTVHEKLQNFTAEEDRGTWSEAARREFFASLFGGAGVLDERDDQEQQGDEGGREEEEGLRLFRS